MNVITIETKILAPIQRVFDLARSVEFHVDSLACTKEKAVAGVTTGLLVLGDEVTWRGRHLGLTRTMTVRVSAFTAPDYFCDELVRGPFIRFDHHHCFTVEGENTAMQDVLYYAVPGGLFGRMFNAVVLGDHLRSLFAKRSTCLKRTAESDEWKRYLAP